MTERESSYIVLLFTVLYSQETAHKLPITTISLFFYVFRPALSSSDGLLVMLLGESQVSTLTICYTKLRLCVFYTNTELEYIVVAI